jgi:hypothetical protein
MNYGLCAPLQGILGKEHGCDEGSF